MTTTPPLCPAIYFWEIFLHIFSYTNAVLLQFLLFVDIPVALEIVARSATIVFLMQEQNFLPVAVVIFDGYNSRLKLLPSKMHYRNLA